MDNETDSKSIKADSTLVVDKASIDQGSRDQQTLKEEKITVQWDGHDEVTVTLHNGKVKHLQMVGCSQFLELMNLNRKKRGDDISTWPEPKGVSHSELLLKELLLKLKHQWDFPYKESELCNCRHVTAQKVDAAILAGAHTIDLVRRWTSASSACGTCQPDVEKIIAYRLNP
ncbi:MAG: (2Fe-2S)-binding protein [Pseudobdellovibrionaceae bacterium]